MLCDIGYFRYILLPHPLILLLLTTQIIPLFIYTSHTHRHESIKKTLSNIYVTEDSTSSESSDNESIDSELMSKASKS